MSPIIIKGKTFDTAEEMMEHLRKKNMERSRFSKFKDGVRFRLRDVSDFFKYDAPQGIQNVIRWLPIIWKDRDYDHTFLTQMLIFKLENMEKLHREYGHLENSEKYADQIREVKLLLEEWEEVEGMDFTGKHMHLLDEAFEIISKNLLYWWD